MLSPVEKQQNTLPLERPEIPLNTNAIENDLRKFVTKLYWGIAANKMVEPGVASP